MVFAFGLQELSLPDVPAPGLQLYTNGSELSTWLLGGGYAVAGAGALELPYTVPAFLGGYTLFHQAFLFDPGVPGYLTQTQGLRIDYP